MAPRPSPDGLRRINIVVSAAMLLVGCRGHRTPGAADAGSERGASGLAVLEGQVHDRRGAAVPAARILCWPAAGDGAIRELKSGADGRFSVIELRAGKHQLLVEAPGFESLTISEVAVPGQPLELTLQGETRSIAGVVRLKGVAVDGARVLLGELERAPREARTAPDGSFGFHGLGPGTYRLRAARGQHVSATQIISLDAAQPPPLLQVDLGQGAIVSGKIADDAGGAVASAEITMESIPGDGLPETTLSNDDGLWAIGPLPPGEFLVSARRAGYLQADAGRLTLKSTAGRARQDLTLIRAARVRGRVVGSDGRPVAGQAVRMLRGNAAELSVVLGALPLAAEAASLPATRMPQLGRVRSMQSDAEGRFDFADLAPGKAALDVSPPGKLPVRMNALLLEPGRVTEVGDLVLRDGVTVTGHVYDQAGLPQAAHVTARPRGTGSEPAFADTDRHGLFTVQVSPGEMELIVSGAGLATETVSLTVGSEAPAPLEVRLIRADVAVDGLVRDSAGRPLGGARVVARLASGSDGASWGGAVTDPGGHFRLTGLPRRELRVEATHPRYPSASVSLEPGGPATIILPVPGGIAGEVREWGAGAPVTTWTIEARGPDGRTASATRGPAGAFNLTRLAPGGWTLAVRAPGYLPAEQTVTVPPAFAVGELSVRDVRIELRR